MSKTTAPDIFGKSQHWMEKVSSIRLSNIRLGQHLTSFLGDNEKPNLSDKSFRTSFTRLLHFGSDVYVLVGGASGVRLWKSSVVSGTNNEFSTTLLREFVDMPCIDACFSHTQGDYITTGLLMKGSSESPQHIIRTLSILSPTVMFNERDFYGEAQSISATRHYLLVSLPTGFLRIVHTDTLEPVAEIPSIPNSYVVSASSARWIAVQTPLSEVMRSPHSAPTSSVIGEADMGETARKVVSGLYSLSKVSWRVMSPLIRKAYTSATSTHHPPPSEENIVTPNAHTGAENGPGTVVGGGVLVLDIGSHRPTKKNTKDKDNTLLSISSLPICAHFLAHSGDLSAMAFSPTGLKLASSDMLGQVILVHALVPAGSLCSTHQVVSGTPSGSLRYPQLLYKLVRGLSLAKIVEIGFDESEMVAYASSLNGTVHIFDLYHASSSDSTENRSGGSSWSHSSFPDPGSSPATTATNFLSGSAGGSSGGMLTIPQAAERQGVGADAPPHANVTHFLQLHRKDARVLQGYSDLRVKLPMRHGLTSENPSATPPSKHNGHADATESATNNGGGTAGSSVASFTLSEVNIQSHCALYLPSNASDSNGGLELMCGTSEGLLSRFRVVLKSAATLHGQVHHAHQTVNELNRWDLCAPLPTADSLESEEESTESACKAALTAPGSVSLATWLYIAGQEPDSAVHGPPLWMRPQVTLRCVCDSSPQNQFPISSHDSHKDVEEAKKKGGKKKSQTNSKELGTSADRSTVVKADVAEETKKSGSKKAQSTSNEQGKSEGLSPALKSTEFSNGCGVNRTFFPERLQTRVLDVKRPRSYSDLDSPGDQRRYLTSEVEEQIRFAMETNMEPQMSSTGQIVVTKRAPPVEDISAWEMEMDWESGDNSADNS
mmetsp:Transcript_12967/g.19533  ORF Transcript_12967/g.19533 Transcript_12967/m.19533 type:complete len:889 (-) Transcript_12967:185-2851(-)|eukprot:CAMPEP_0185032766 /NCGR_PEP_ID=MMETSP1103-20130426/21147_1 /TAXON_ID=36769 /ORGANISM="Paraphysomonas bandaiensis, Strain Caron Lab Isolate" /LENGTH=888 /DNA_ID=CAMNT_0027568785 /DNA_START=106 /DNA_END=2772 /DNA_ORIENTATION=-